MLKLYHAQGVFQSSVSWVTIDRAWESCGDYWINRVRLASDRASTDCWQWPCPVSCRENGEDPRKYSEHPNILPQQLSPPPQAARLTSPHQNVRWQNRKAAVCSRHLKVHLHTLFQQSPSAPIPAKAVGVGYRDQCLDQHTCGFQLLLFSDCVCLVAFLNFSQKKSHKT